MRVLNAVRRRFRNTESGGKWFMASVAGMALIFALAVRLALDSGITLDEDVQREYGQHILNWFRSGFTDNAAVSFSNLYLYGGLFDLAAQWFVSLSIAPWGVFETRHVLTAFIAALGIVATWKTAHCVGGARAGFMGAAMLALTPTWVGHGMFNPKDIPFATAAAFATYASARICRRPAPLSWKDAMYAGLSVGAALAVRPGGMFLLGYPAAAAFARLLLETFLRQRRGEPTHALQKARAIILRLTCALVLAWSLMVSAWPWAQRDPLRRPIDAANAAANFGWNSLMIFNGQHVSPHELPASYLPTWFAITLPETYLLALCCAIIGLLSIVVKKPAFDLSRTLLLLLLTMCVAAPYAAVVITRPVIYDAYRHFLFMLPPLAALAGIALSYVLGTNALWRSVRAAIAVLCLGLAGLTVFDMVSLHPYEYIHFNRTFGGLPAAVGRFETDYWGAANREGFAWVTASIEPRPGKRIPVAACYTSWQIDYYRKQWPGVANRFSTANQEDRAQIFLATTRDNCHKKFGEVIHKVERQGVPLLYVLKR